MHKNHNCDPILSVLFVQFSPPLSPFCLFSDCPSEKNVYVVWIYTSKWALRECVQVWMEKRCRNVFLQFNDFFEFTEQIMCECVCSYVRVQSINIYIPFWWWWFRAFRYTWTRTARTQTYCAVFIPTLNSLTQSSCSCHQAVVLFCFPFSRMMRWLVEFSLIQSPGCLSTIFFCCTNILPNARIHALVSNCVSIFSFEILLLWKFRFD